MDPVEQMFYVEALQNIERVKEELRELAEACATPALQSIRMPQLPIQRGSGRMCPACQGNRMVRTQSDFVTHKPGVPCERCSVRHLITGVVYDEVKP